MACNKTYIIEHSEEMDLTLTILLMNNNKIKLLSLNLHLMNNNTKHNIYKYWPKMLNIYRKNYTTEVQHDNIA